MTDRERLHDALLAARSLISGALADHPDNDWWGVSIARRHLDALAAAASELVTVAGRQTVEPDSALDAALREVAPSARAPRMTLDDLGGYYEHGDGSLWQLVLYSDEPTATLLRVDRPAALGICPQPRRSGVVGAPIFDGFRKLVPEGEPQ